VIRTMLEAFNAGQYETAADLMHDEGSLEQWGALPDSGTYRGKPEWIRAVGLWLDAFEPGFQFVIEQITDAGDGVLASITLRGKGRTSGVLSEQSVFHLYEVRDGKAYRCKVFSEEGEARRAAGLPAR
jgi:ketosteroid isomerase-like protein